VGEVARRRPEDRTEAASEAGCLIESRRVTRRQRLPRFSGRQWLGTALLLVATGLTVLLAYLAGAKQAPSQAAQAELAALIIAAQLGAAWVFSGYGKADPSHAERSAARLFRLAQRARDCGHQTQELFEDRATQKHDLHAAMGIASTNFDWLQDGLIEAIGDWRVFHPRAVEQAEGNDDDGT
jgi:hypothetical protein